MLGNVCGTPEITWCVNYTSSVGVVGVSTKNVYTTISIVCVMQGRKLRVVGINMCGYLELE